MTAVSPSPLTSAQRWPELHLANWAETRDTLHMWTQIVGHIRMALSPPVNHWWHVTLYVTSRGLTTSPIPYADRAFEIHFDLLDHRLLIATSRNEWRALKLEPKSVADFYKELMGLLDQLGIQVKIHSKPDEVSEPIPFAEDRVHHSYDPEYAHRFWQILVATDSVLKEFRGRFLGKCSPVHFYWGSFDLCCTRFSGRRAPERLGADAVTREAYSQEVISVGFWPGSGAVDDAAFYAYAAPEPQGFRSARVLPASASYNETFGEYILMYEDLRRQLDPKKALLE
ncbi:MAG TPA: DUF5996 family protein, partial [Terriglobales bacterium]|nr:DUF5996 family protein [Terriglobales bacterium]